jgi:glucose/arabinose dehydrogenase
VDAVRKASSRRAWRALLVCVVGTAGLMVAPGDLEAQPSPVESVVLDLAVPWGLAFLPDRSALVTERDTARLVHVAYPSRVATTVGTVPGVVPGGEGGLLGIAVSPTFAADRYVYLYYTAASDNRIVRARYENGQLGPQEVVLSGLAKGFIHNGGRIAFGPDGMLYAGVGDAGNTANSQNLGSLNGKILRMTPTGAPAPGNPYNTRVWSSGHRNVQGLAWDTAGRMYASEFGQNTYDELNRIEPGRNYGWPVVEGTGTDARYTNPLATWTTAEASPSGLAYDSGALWMAGLRGQRLWRIPVNADGSTGQPQAFLNGEYGRLRTVEPQSPGMLWVATSNRDGRGTPRLQDDRILSVDPGGLAGEPQPPEGECVRATNQAHVQAGRAAAWLIFAWARGTNEYLGLVWSTTSLRETSEGVWDLVTAC